MLSVPSAGAGCIGGTPLHSISNFAKFTPIKKHANLSSGDLGSPGAGKEQSHVVVGGDKCRKLAEVWLRVQPLGVASPAPDD